MRKNELSCCSYPTKVILIDDNASFLSEMQLALSLKNIQSVAFLNSRDFYDYLEKYAAETFVHHCLRVAEDADPDHRVIDIDLGNIYQKSYDPARFDEVAVIITDYAMPDIDGFTLLQKCEHDYPIKNILLTGVADEKIAVDAFNQGLIDAFIRKDTPDFVENLVQKVRALQACYFSELSEFVFNQLSGSRERALACFADAEYVAFVKQVLADEKIVEHYLLDECGSFLLVNAHGKTQWLAVRDEDEMQRHCDIAAEHLAEQNIAAEVVAKLNERSHLLFLGVGDMQNLEPLRWEQRLYRAKNFTGQKKYYYALVVE